MIGLYLAASGAAATLGALSSVADSIANLGTPGFKRILNQTEAVTGNGSPYQFAVADQAPTIDMSQGALQSTNNAMDVAISGTGFITVQGPNGTAYTRNGTLAISPDGTLTAAGYPVLTPAGGTISIKTPGTLVIGSDGTVSVNGQPAGQIAMAEPHGHQDGRARRESLSGRERRGFATRNQQSDASGISGERERLRDGWDHLDAHHDAQLRVFDEGRAEYRHQ